MRIHVSPQDGKPIYRQIVSQIKYLVAARRLRPGDELPPIRTLAEQLLINPNTVARAYRELETAGILIKRHGAGTYVADGGSPLAQSERERILSERIDALLAEADQLGFSLEKTIALVRKRHADLGAPQEENHDDQH